MDSEKVWGLFYRDDVLMGLCPLCDTAKTAEELQSLIAVRAFDRETLEPKYGPICRPCYRSAEERGAA